jgi:UDPglucose 6-dehydrogenase
VETALEAIAGADLVILVTEWPEFLDIDWDAAGSMMKRRVVIDGRNVLSGEQLAASGFSYASFGRGSLLPKDETSNGLFPSLSRQRALRWGEG